MCPPFLKGFWGRCMSPEVTLEEVAEVCGFLGTSRHRVVSLLMFSDLERRIRLSLTQHGPWGKIRGLERSGAI